MAGRLTVCPTPIGNLEDLSPRARRALGEADLVACEDTRRTGRLYERLDIARPRLVSNHEGNEAERARPARAADRARRQGRAGLRRRDAGDLRPGLPADPRLHRARPRGRGAAGSLGGHDRAGRLRAARRSLAVRGLPPAPRRRARAGAALGRDRGRLRVAAAPARLAGGARVAGAQPPGGGLPRADQAPRGGRARHPRRAGAAASATRSRARSWSSSRRPPPAPTGPTWPSRSTRCDAWSSRAPAPAPRPRWSPPSRAPGPTTSTAG